MTAKKDDTGTPRPARPRKKAASRQAEAPEPVSQDSGVGRVFGREPVLWLTALRAAIVCAVAFGLDVSAEQGAAMYVVLEAVLGLAARARVSPVGFDS